MFQLILSQQYALFIVIAFALIFSLTFHEFGHAKVAAMIGDNTAKNAGRLTLNPIAHIDPLGSVIIPAFLFLTNASFLFGWAKPVPVNLGMPGLLKKVSCE